MESATDFEPIVRVAFWTSLAFAGLSIFTMILLLELRRRAKFVENRRALVREMWKSDVFEAVYEESSSFDDPETIYFGQSDDLSDPATEHLIADEEWLVRKNLTVEDLPELLKLWNYLHESVRGSEKTNLNRFALNHGIPKLNEKLFKSKSLDKKLLAVNTFGNLADEKYFEPVKKLTLHRDPIISFWAFRALLRINREKVLRDDLQILAERKDWSPIFVAKTLKEIPGDDLSEPLVGLIAENYRNGLEERQMSRLISYLIFTHRSSHCEIINKILRESNETEILIACLRLVFDEEMLPRVRELLKDERWQVRLHAVLRLGYFGKDEDVEKLLVMLNDLDWWVRYRAAWTLFSMPSMTIERITEFSENLPNKFSRDMLKQILAENEFQCSTQMTLTSISR